MQIIELHVWHGCWDLFLKWRGNWVNRGCSLQTGLTCSTTADFRKWKTPFPPFSDRIKILDVFAEQTLESVFSRLIEPPVIGSLDAARQRLQDLGALTADEKLTPLGYHLACLPVDVRIGKLMLFGAIFRCLDPALTIAASLAFKSPFVRNHVPRVGITMLILESVSSDLLFVFII